MVNENKAKSLPLVKVMFALGSDQWHGYETESVWAEKLSPDRCRIRNTPFFVKGVSFEDVIFIKHSNDELWFESVSISAGRSSYRIIVDRDLPAEIFSQYWSPLEKLGCTYESMEDAKRLLAVDVPQKADIYEVYSRLEKGELDGVWDFEEGHCGHVLS